MLQFPQNSFANWSAIPAYRHHSPHTLPRGCGCGFRESRPPCTESHPGQIMAPNGSIGPDGSCWLGLDKLAKKNSSSEFIRVRSAYYAPTSRACIGNATPHVAQANFRMHPRLHRLYHDLGLSELCTLRIPRCAAVWLHSPGWRNSSHRLYLPLGMGGLFCRNRINLGKDPRADCIRPSSCP